MVGPVREEQIPPLTCAVAVNAPGVYEFIKPLRYLALGHVLVVWEQNPAQLLGGIHQPSSVIGLGK